MSEQEAIGVDALDDGDWQTCPYCDECLDDEQPVFGYDGVEICPECGEPL